MIHIDNVDYRADGTTMTGHLACPDTAGPRPAVLVLHEGIGLNDFQRRRADHLAEAGYVALAMDYLAGRWFTDPADMMPVLGPLIADPERMRDIGLAALQVLLDHHQVDPSRVAALGFGTGGSIALELGRAGVPLAAIAVVNPVLPADQAQRWANLACPLLICVGAKDPLAPATFLNEATAQLDAAGTDWQLVLHGGAEHAFHLPPLNVDGSVSTDSRESLSTPGVAHHLLHAQRAWRAIAAHLAEAFTEPAPGVVP